MKSDFKALAKAHNLLNISVTFFADAQKYSASVQWLDSDGKRECVFSATHLPDIDEAIASAIAEKVKLDAETEEYTAARKAELLAYHRRELAKLTGE